MRYLYLISLLFTVDCFAQTPAILSINGFGGDGPDKIDNHVVKTDDGGFIIKISSFPFTTGNIPNCNDGDPGYQRLFRKYNADGNTVLWDRCYSPGSNVTDTTVHYVFPADNGNFYTIRSYGVVGELKRYCLNLENSNQNTIWTGPGYGNAQNLYLNSVCRASDGGFILAFSSDFAGGDVPSHYGSNTFSDIWVIKLDQLGNHIWDNVIGGSYRDKANKILPTSEGGCFIAGFSASTDFDCIGNNGFTDAYIVKIDSDGNKVWHKCIGGPEYDAANDIILTDNHELYIAGNAGANGTYVHNHYGGSDMYLIKMDTGGNVLMDKCYGGQFDETAYSLAVCSDGAIWLTGDSHKKGGQVDTSFGLTSATNDCWIVKVEPNGDFMGAKVLGAIGHDNGVFISPLISGGVLIGGEYSVAGDSGSDFLTSNYGSTDIFLVRFASWTLSAKDVVKKDAGYRIYPNPGKSTLNIEMGKNSKPYSNACLLSTDGKLVRKYEVSGKRTVCLSTDGLVNGVYYLRLANEANILHVEKIIILN